jgi:BirA family transcriptional regulator, biotin operon repressor / biotin---[acetyl-CoA-carboxylase] ligase
LTDFQNINFKNETFFSEHQIISNCDNLILHFESLNSTNTFAKNIKSDFFNRNSTVIIADEQTAGHGRLNRPWFSSPNHSLTFTLIKKCGSNLQIELLPLITALALARTMDSYVDPNIVDIKWPNDILIDHKKVSGILIENRLYSDEQILFIGIGINIKSSIFPTEITDTACSIESHTDSTINKDELLKNFLDNYDQLFNTLHLSNQENIIEEFSARSSYVNHKKISYYENEQKKIGISDGLDSNGALFCLDDNGVRHRLIVSEIHSVREGEL